MSETKVAEKMKDGDKLMKVSRRYLVNVIGDMEVPLMKLVQWTHDLMGVLGERGWR